MPAPLSTDIRIRVLEARVREGLTYEQLADRFVIGRASVDRILRRARETGSVEPAPHGGGPARRITQEVEKVLVELVQTRPDATLEELCSALATRAGVAVSRATMCRELRRLGFTRKKNPWWRPSSARRMSWPSARPSSPRSTPAILSA